MEKTVYLAYLAAKRVARDEARHVLLLSHAVRLQIWGDESTVTKLEADLAESAGHKEPTVTRKKKMFGRIVDFVKKRGGKIENA